MEPHLTTGKTEITALAAGDLIPITDVSNTDGKENQKTVALSELAQYMRQDIVVRLPLAETPGTTMTTGQKAIAHVPAAWNGYKIASAHIEFATAGVTGTSAYDVEINGTTIFTTAITLDTGETGSDTAATPAVVNTAANTLATNDVISVDCDTVHSGTAEKGAVCTLVLSNPNA